MAVLSNGLDDKTPALTFVTVRMQSLPIRIGTRGSKLALVQAHEVRDRLCAACGLAAGDVVIVPITTTGDRITDRPLAAIGGKGLFTKEIEIALHEGAIDLAVHSMKDMPTVLADEFIIETLLPREDPRDAFISHSAGALQDLPHAAVVGSSSIRRQAQIKRLRPDLEVVMYRGNVDTRLRKLREGVVDATLLACAGLVRLGLGEEITAAISIEDMLPAVAQGAIGIEVRRSDEALRLELQKLNHVPTTIEVECERAFLGVLEGSCRTPIAGHAHLDDKGEVSFSGMVLAPDGSAAHETKRHCLAEDVVAAGEDAAAELKAHLKPEWLA